VNRRGRGLPYAIVEDLPSIPHEVRPSMSILDRSGNEAVVQQGGCAWRWRFGVNSGVRTRARPI